MGIIAAMTFDFDAAVNAPFRMQPGLRRVPAGSPQLTPMAPGARHQREKLAVLSAFWPQALCVVPGFDAAPALNALYQHAAQEHRHTWAWDGRHAQALQLGTAVQADGTVQQATTGVFGGGDEVARCLQGLPPLWRQAGLASLAFAEDFAIVDGSTGSIPWLAVALPSHWAPEDNVGRHFTEVHGPVADNELLLKASAGLMKLVAGGAASTERWERFVWNITDQPRLHAHPAHGLEDGLDDGRSRRWQGCDADQAWWRTERQTFLPVAGAAQAVFTIHVDVQPLAQAVNTAARAVALRAALASMSPAVLAYRSLGTMRAPLMAWLQARARALALTA